MPKQNIFTIVVEKCPECPDYNYGEFWFSQDYCEVDRRVKVYETCVPSTCPRLKEGRKNTDGD